MSGESKKKRGESGKSNAKNIAFRYGGSRCDFSTKIGHTTHPRLGGSKFLNAMKLGEVVGYVEGKEPSDRAYKAADENMDVCPITSGDAGNRRKARSARQGFGREEERVVIRRSDTRCDIELQSGDIDLSSCYVFRSVGDQHGLIRPDRSESGSSNNDRASSALIAFMQRQNYFEKKAEQAENA